MTVADALFLTSNGTAPTYSAREWRYQHRTAWFEGIFSGLKVAQRGAGPNMSVDVPVGACVIEGDNQTDQGSYICQVTAPENKTVTAAPGSNSRIDLVVARVNDPTSGGPAGNTFLIEVIAGTPAAAPVAPALPTTAIPLATILIPSGKVSIVNADITDVRAWAAERSAPGTLKPYAGTRTVNGWLPCDGSAVSRTTYARLFDELQTRYGPGDGSTTFNLPDFRGRIPWPLLATESTIDTIGEQGGAYRHTLTTAEMPAHGHNPGTLAASGGDHNHTAGVRIGTTGPASVGILVVDGSQDGNQPNALPASGPGGGHGHTFSGAVANAGSGAAHQNMPPYTVVPGYLICS